MHAPIDRRRALLAGLSALGAFSLAPRALGAPRLYASRALPVSGSRRTLVVLQLAGGNDGLSMVVPHGDDAYHAARPGLRLRGDDVLDLDGYRGLNARLPQLHALYQRGASQIDGYRRIADLLRRRHGVELIVLDDLEGADEAERLEQLAERVRAARNPSAKSAS